MRVNTEIRVDQVRLIDEANNQVGVVDTVRAKELARNASLDLVEVSPMGDPPVCKIMDYGKYLYERKRKQREGRKKSHLHSGSLKEIRLRPETDRHDLDIKLEKARQFLAKGHKVQFTMFFRGRQMLHQDRGHEVLIQIAESMEDVAKVERPGRMAHRRMTLLIVPK